MNSNNFFSQKLALKLNGKTSLSSSGAAIIVFLILALSCWICFPYLRDIWAPYRELKTEYAKILGARKEGSVFQVGIITEKSSDLQSIKVIFKGNPLQMVKCHYKEQNIICFETKESNFIFSEIYKIQIPQNTSVHLIVPTWAYSISDNYLSPTYLKIPLSYQQTLKVQLQKYLIVIDDSLFQFQPNTQSITTSISDYIHFPSFQTSIIFSSKNSQSFQMLTFKRQKLTIVIGKLITCFQFIFVICNIFLLRPYHLIKYKCTIAKKIFDDPIMNMTKLKFKTLFQLTIFSHLPQYLKRNLVGMFDEQIVYINVFVLPDLEQRLSVDNISLMSKQKEQQIILVGKNKRFQRRFLRQAVDNLLDNQQIDEQLIQKCLHKAIKKLFKKNEQPQKTNFWQIFWSCLKVFNISGVPIQFQYSTNTEQLNTLQNNYYPLNPSQQINLKPKYKCNKKYIINISIIVALVILFGAFFMNDIIQYLKHSKKIETYSTVYEDVNAELSGLTIISNQSFLIRANVYEGEGGKQKRQSEVSCNENNTRCTIKQTLSTHLNIQQQIVIRITTSSNITLSLNTTYLTKQQLLFKQFSLPLPSGSLTQLLLQFIDSKSSSQLNTLHFISYPNTITTTPNLLSPTNIQLRFKLSLSGTIRKITYNNLYTIINSSWSIIRLIVATFIMQLVIKPLNNTSNYEDEQQQQPNSQKNILKDLDITFLLNFVNTKAEKEKRYSNSNIEQNLKKQLEQ